MSRERKTISKIRQLDLNSSSTGCLEFVIPFGGEQLSLNDTEELQESSASGNLTAIELLPF